MAMFSMRMQIIGRGGNKSIIAAAAYRSGEKLRDERQSMTHDYRNRKGVEHKEILLPANAPEWVQGIDRQRLWGCVDAFERRVDSQTARELRVMIPRELDPPERIRLVRDYVLENFVQRGMCADICWHNKVASDGLENCHAHILLTLRPLAPEPGKFGQKSRHEWVPDPTGRTHPDGRPVMVESNPDSWNSAAYYERCREAWEKLANEALARAGSTERIDRRSFLERGIARMPEPALRLAHYLNDLYGVMKERFGQFQMARHYRAVETAAKEALGDLEAPQSDFGAAEAAQTQNRFFGWFERQLERLASERVEQAPTHTQTIDLER